MLPFNMQKCSIIYVVYSEPCILQTTSTFNHVKSKGSCTRIQVTYMLIGNKMTVKVGIRTLDLLFMKQCIYLNTIVYMCEVDVASVTSQKQSKNQESPQKLS